MSTDPANATMSSGLAAVLAEFEETRNTLLRLVTAERIAESDPPSDDGELPEGEDVLYQKLLGLRRMILSNPSTSSSVVKFLVDEGRRYASTAEGARQYAAMVGSPEVERLRTVWEKVTLNLLDDDAEESQVPQAWTDLVRDLAIGSGLERLADRLRPDGLA